MYMLVCTDGYDAYRPVAVGVKLEALHARADKDAEFDLWWPTEFSSCYYNGVDYYDIVEIEEV